MKPQSVVINSAVSSSNWITVDHNQNPFNIGFGVVKAGGGDITYTVRHTFNDVDGGGVITEFDHSTVSGKTTSIDGNYAFPVWAVRLVTTAVSGSATASLFLIQGG